MKEGAAYCINCGTPAHGADEAPSQDPAGPERRRSSPLLKVLATILGLILLLGTAGVIASIYAAHRFKQAAVQAAKEGGVDLRDLNSSPPGPIPDACSLMTAPDASAIMGVTIDRVTPHGNSCDYFASGTNEGSDPYFTIEVNPHGETVIAALKLSLGMIKATEPLTGIGDEALMGPMESLLVFVKNGLGVSIDFHGVGKGREREIALARQIASRL